MFRFYITDERVIAFENNDKIFDSFPGVLLNAKEQPIRVIPTQEEYYVIKEKNKVSAPFSGCTMCDCYTGSWLLNKIVKKRHSLIKRQPCLVAVSPVSSYSELLAMKRWYERWYDRKFPQLIWEPIAFLNGMGIASGIVISVRNSMVEVSLVINNKISKYWWEYHDCNKAIERDVPQRRILGIYRKLISTIRDYIGEDNKNPIFFTSYKNILTLNAEDTLKYKITVIKYDQFCLDVIKGLQLSKGIYDL